MKTNLIKVVEPSLTIVFQPDMNTVLNSGSTLQPLFNTAEDNLHMYHRLE